VPFIALAARYGLITVGYELNRWKIAACWR
jgi:hypothetical protein